MSKVEISTFGKVSKNYENIAAGSNKINLKND